MTLATASGSDCGGQLEYVEMDAPVRVGDVLVWAKRCTRCGREIRTSALIFRCPLEARR